jgi:hypothetical protein
MSLTDFFYTTVYGGDDLATQGKALDAQLAAKNGVDYAPGGRVYNDIAKTSGTAAADNAFQITQNNLKTGSYDYQLAQSRKDENATPGIADLLKDLFVIGAIGGALWAFFNFGGTGLLKSLAKKNKYYVLGIAGAAGLLAWFIYKQFKKTSSDASSTASGLADSIKQLNPLS